MIKNPILPGFNPDPCICRKGDDYYIATSTFEWMPGIMIYHSKDLEHWEALSAVITDEKTADLKKLPSAKGIWAPCLTYCEEEDLFYVVFGIMNSMNARYFDVDNYLVTAKDISGPWSEPVYLHSAGFDASILHDGDKKWVVSLLWETRDNYEKPGSICVAEYDSKSKKIIGYPKAVYRGATDRGCIEAPHLYKKNEYYYMMCAEGGTGYYHGVTLSRSKSPFGPYESGSVNPIITSYKDNNNERKDTDHLKPHYYADGVYLQKSGHGSLVETKDGTPYIAHLCSRPLMPEKACTLGRETAIQKMKWTDNGWLIMASGSNIAEEYTKSPNLLEFTPKALPEKDTFDSKKLSVIYASPRIMPDSFSKITENGLEIRGQESLSSLNRTSLIARRLTSLDAVIETKFTFTPEIYRHTSGITFYYDNMNYIYLKKYFSESENAPCIMITTVDNGEKTDIESAKIKARGENTAMRISVKGHKLFFEYKFDDMKEFEKIGDDFPTAKFSDEYSNFGEFTGSFVGMAATDEMFRRKTSTFRYFSYKDN